MATRILKNADGSFRRVWYGRLTRNGRKVDIKLDVGPIKGEIPTTPGGQWDRNAKGDAAFERSREAAEKAFLELVKGDGKRRQSLERLENARRALTGQGFVRTPLSTLFSKWSAIKRQKPPTEIRKGIAKTTFSNFAAFADTFARKCGKTCTTLEDVSPEMAAAYFEKLKGQYAWETAKGRFSLMRNAWRRFARANGETNPFDGVILRGGAKDERARISRVPLTLNQAKRLFEIVREKRPSLFPLVACAATTGLRLGDAVALKWSDIELERNPAAHKNGRFGTIGLREGLATSKTGARVVLPIIEPFASVLRDMNARRDDRDEYLFPAELERYNHASKSKSGKTNFSLRSGLVREIKPFFALAVADDTKARLEQVEEVKEPKTLDETLALIEAARFAPTKAKRLRMVAEVRATGAKAKTISQDLGLSPAQVSADLRTLEELTGDKLRSSDMGRRESELGTAKRELVKLTRRGGAPGRQAASIYGWHSLRATFVVLALEAGVPLAYVEKAVGHATTNMTLQYFNPTGQHAAAAIGSRLGSALAATLAADGEIVEERPAALPAPSLEEQIDALSADEKKALARHLLGL